VTVAKVAAAGEVTLDQSGPGDYELEYGEYRITASAKDHEPKPVALVVDKDLDPNLLISLTPVKPAGLPSAIDHAIGLSFVRIPAGSFDMGAADNQHEETIASDFYLTAAEVTFRQFQEFVAATDYVTTAERYGGRGYVEGKYARHSHLNWREPGFLEPVGGAMFDLPVVQVTYNDATAFCNWLTDSPDDEAVYRLPTSAEWEYACRAGTATSFWTGDQLDPKAANFDSSRRRVVAVAGYEKNPWGLFHMHGNAAEWCQDLAADSESRHVIRGGAWDDPAEQCRSDSLRSQLELYMSCKLGFRVVREVGLEPDAVDEEP
jgi:formylglycine-generating enzyme required for sulfatase activity